MLARAVCPGGDEGGRLRVVDVCGRLEFRVDGHGRGHAEEDRRSDGAGVACGGVEGDEGPHGVPHEVSRAIQCPGEAGHPVGDRLDRVECGPLGTAVAGEVDGHGPEAVVGEEPGLVRPDRPVHAGSVEQHDERFVPSLERHGSGGGVDGAVVDDELHGRLSAARPAGPGRGPGRCPQGPRGRPKGGSGSR